MEFVEDDEADAVQRRIVEDHAGEDALGDHLDSRRGRDLGLHADAEADGLAHRLAQESWPAARGGGGASGQTARFQDDDLAIVTDHGWSSRARGTTVVLPAAGGGDQHGAGPRHGQGRFQRIENLMDRQHPCASSRQADRSPAKRLA